MPGQNDRVGSFWKPSHPAEADGNKGPGEISPLPPALTMWPPTGPCRGRATPPLLKQWGGQKPFKEETKVLEGQATDAYLAPEPLF